MINRSLTTISCFVLFAFLVPVAFADASAVVRTGDTVSVADDQKIEGSFYTAAGTVSISGEIEEDILSAAGSITINGTVGADALLMAGNVDVHGTVNDDLRVLANEVVIAEPVLGDVFVIAESVKILSTASVSGDVLLYAADAEISGTVAGNVYGTMANLRIDNSVEGSVDISVDTFALGDQASIQGDVRYTSGSSLVRSPNAVVGGEVVKNDPIIEAVPVSAQSILVPILIGLFSLLVWYLLSRWSLVSVVNTAMKPSVKAVIFGILTILLAPFAISILLVSVLGSVLGVVLLLAYLLLLLLSLVAVSAILGAFVFRLFDKTSVLPNYLSLLLGSLLFVALLFVPVVGPAIIVGVLVIAAGVMIEKIINGNAR